MLFIIIAMLVIVAVAGLVVTFVAFPHRGEDVPGAPWLGDAMNQAAEALPTIEDGELEQHQAAVAEAEARTDAGPEQGTQPEHKH